MDLEIMKALKGRLKKENKVGNFFQCEELPTPITSQDPIVLLFSFFTLKLFIDGTWEYESWPLPGEEGYRPIGEIT